MNGIFGLFFWLPEAQWAGTDCEYLLSFQSKKKKKKENSAEYPRKETLRADEQLPKIRRQSSDSTPALNTVHFTLDPAYATNNCKLTLMY